MTGTPVQVRPAEPCTLFEYFTSRSVKPPSVLGKASSPPFDPADIDSTYAVIHEKDPEFVRLRALVEATLSHPGGRAQTVRDLGLRLLRAELASRGDNATFDPERPESSLKRVGRVVATASSDREVRAIATNLLVIAIVCFASGGNVPEERVVAVTADSLGATGVAGGETAGNRRLAYLVNPLGGDPVALARFTGPLHLALRREEGLTAQLRRDGLRSARMVEELRLELSELEAQRSRLVAELEAAKAEAESSAQEIATARTSGRIDLSALRRETRAGLKRGAKAAQIAAEAASVDPPRVGVIQEQVAFVLATLDEEVKRLSRGSGG